MKFLSTILFASAGTLLMTATCRAALVGAPVVATNQTTTAGAHRFSFAPAVHLDRYAALSMIESGDNDFAVGRAGEISRYQIKRQYWIEGNPHDAAIALANAKAIMAVRTLRFATIYKHQPTDFEFYVLWNAPAVFFARLKISAAIADRAARFENLFSR